MNKCDTCKHLFHDRSVGCYECLRQDELTDRELDEVFSDGVSDDCSQYEQEQEHSITRYVIQDREAGNVIDEFNTLTEAKAELERYEEQDKQDGIYTPNFYEIVCMTDWI